MPFFGLFFHSSLAPAIECGAIWPPQGLEVLNAWELPFLNTVILLTSGAAVTWAHHAILSGYRTDTYDAFLFTLFLAFFFTMIQFDEYVHAPFSIADGVYGSTFFIAT